MAGEGPRPAADKTLSVLEALADSSTGWTVHLALLSGDEAVYVAKIEGAKPYHLASRVGMSLRLHCTSTAASTSRTDLSPGRSTS